MSKIIIFITILFFNLFAYDNGQLPLKGYNLPENKEGIADRNYNALSDKRYEVLKNKLDIGIQKYNYYWENAENFLPSSEKPLKCKKGYFLFPVDKNQKKLLKIHKYHCYKKRFVTQWEKRFKKNKNFNIQIALVLWTTPKMYRNNGCEGFSFPLQNKHLMEGCFPAKEHYDDYEDWIKFTAYTFGDYVDHYIVWNEVDSSDWADSSSKKFPKIKMIKNLKYNMYRTFKIYVELLKRTINSVDFLDKKCLNKNGSCKNFIYVSITRDWYKRTPRYKIDKKGEVHIKWQNMNLLDYIWKELSLNYNWSIAVHPYGSVYNKKRKFLTFSTLKDLSNYQKNQINSRKENNISWLNYPQSRLFASEQNVGRNVKANNWNAKAKFICEAYDVAMKMPEIIAITHNHFQDNINSKNKKPTKYTMLPASVKADLSNAYKYPTFKAYLSTTPKMWWHSNKHYCCKKYGLGCKDEFY